MPVERLTVKRHREVSVVAAAVLVLGAWLLAFLALAGIVALIVAAL